MLVPSPENQDATFAALHKSWPDLVAIAQGGASPQRPDVRNCPLWDLYAPVAEGRGEPAYVIAQLGQSLDGRVATATGKSRYINGPEAIRHLHRLRALVDAVVVGVGTVVADDPQLNVREVEGPCPARVVIDPNYRLPAGAKLTRDPALPIYAIQADGRPRGPGVEPIVVPRHGGEMRPGDMVAALAARGFRRILIEGGAHTVSSFLTAGALHRFHLSIAPIVIGAGPVGINLPPIDELDGALRPMTMTHQLGNDVLFDCLFSSTPGLEPA
jgi:riboflavin-specific deaminase-like protein